MPTVIDSLVVTLGLDPKAFKSGVETSTYESEKLKKKIVEIENEIVEAKKKAAGATGEEAEKLNKKISKMESQLADSRYRASNEQERQQKKVIDGNKKQIDSLTSLSTEFLALFGVVAGAEAIKGFVGGVIDTNIKIGQLSTNLGVSIQDLGAWDNAIKLTHGSVDDLNGSIANLVNAREMGQLGLPSQALAAYRALGVAPSDLEDPFKAMMEARDELLKKSGPEQAAMAKLLGWGPDTLQLLQKNNTELQSLMAEAQENNKLTDASRQASIDAAKATEDWNQALGGLGQTLAVSFLPALTVAATNLTKLLRGENPLATGPSPTSVGASINWDNKTPSIDWTGKNKGGSQGASAIATALVSGGLSPEIARGVAAGVAAESNGGDPLARNPKSGAYGLTQLLTPSRLANYQQMFGHTVQSVRDRERAFSEQIKFLLWELHGGDKGGAAVLGSRTSEEAMRNFVTQFERPKLGYETMRDIISGLHTLSSGGASGGIPGTSSGGRTDIRIAQIGPIVSSAKDAAGIAKDIGGAVRKYSFVPHFDNGIQ